MVLIAFIILSVIGFVTLIRYHLQLTWQAGYDKGWLDGWKGRNKK